MKKNKKSGIPIEEDNAWEEFCQHWLSRGRYEHLYRTLRTKTIDETIEMAFREGWRTGREKLLNRIAERMKTYVFKHILGG